MKKSKGFTLIELLVAAAIIAIISVLSTQILFDTLTIRSKQSSIAEVDENLRMVLNSISQDIMESDSIMIPSPGTVQIWSENCKTIRHNLSSFSLEGATDSGAGCLPPASGFSALTGKDIKVMEVEFFQGSPTSPEVNIKISGEFLGDFENHSFSYQTTVVPRVRP